MAEMGEGLLRIRELLTANGRVFISERAAERLEALDPEVAGEKAGAAFRRWLGWEVPKDFAIFDAVRRAHEPNELRALETYELVRSPPRTEPPLKSFRAAMTALSGLVPLSRGLWGPDSTWVSVFPSASGMSPVYLLDEGVLTRQLTPSLGDFVVRFLQRSEPDDPATLDGWVGEACQALAADPPAGPAAWADPMTLHPRSRWLFAIAEGHPRHIRHFMAAAAPLTAFETEKAHFARAPWLAAYWLVAHAFLGNVDAGREAMEHASDVPGELVPMLREGVAPFFEGVPTPFAGLGEGTLDEAIESSRANASDAQRESAPRS